MIDTWPRTGRWLPWLIAGFLVLAWFIPIDSVTPRGFSAFDLKLDRVLLAVIGIIWLASVCAGGPGAPRLRRLGPAGVAVIAFGLVALFSVLLNLHVLLVTGDSELATRKLLLLGSYVAFFVIVATTLRADEVPAMTKLFMWLGVIAAAGILYDRFEHTNPFFWLADHTLPGSGFSIRKVATSPGDPHPITGPSRHALGAAGMLSMAVPFALVEALRTVGVRRVVHWVAFVVLVGGVWATNRKTGVFASVAALGFLVVVQPRTMLVRALPAIAVGLLVVAALKPHALTYELNQIAPGNVTKGASSQGRSSDYSAIGPDIRAHPGIGRGWGSYDPDRYRILDNNYLLLLIETGLAGIIAFAAMAISVWGMARRVARISEPRAGPALAAAAGTVAFVISMALFDAMSFPQVPYFFFFLAAVVCVLWREVVVVEDRPVRATVVPATA